MVRALHTRTAIIEATDASRSCARKSLTGHDAAASACCRFASRSPEGQIAHAHPRL